jgi:hypothetical protein
MDFTHFTPGAKSNIGNEFPPTQNDQTSEDVDVVDEITIATSLCLFDDILVSTFSLFLFERLLFFRMLVESVKNSGII